MRSTRNPFAGATAVEFYLPERTDLALSIYDATGHRIAALVEAQESAGRHSVVRDGMDEAGRFVPAEVYMARFVFGDEVATLRISRAQ